MKSVNSYIIVFSVLLLMLSGCAKNVNIPLAESSNKKVAILPVRYPPQTDGISFFRTHGVAQSAIKGAAMGTIIGAQTAELIPVPVFLVFIPIGATGGLVVGAITGAVSADSEKEAPIKNKELQTEDETRKILADLRIQEKLAKCMQEAGKKETDRIFVIFNDLGPSVPEDRPDYTSLARQGFKDILELSVNKIGSGHFGLGDSAKYYFYMTAQARLTRDTRISTPEFKYIIGPPRKLSEWLNFGGEALVKEIDQAYNAIAEDLMEYVFLYVFFEGEYAQPPLGILSVTSEALERVFKISTSKIYNTRCVLGGLHGVSLQYPLPQERANVYDLQPTFSWEEFPAQEDIRADRKGIVKNVSDVTYELKVWQEKGENGRDLIYEKKGLKDNKHKIEYPLLPETQYLWSVRAHYRFGGEDRVTRWSRPCWGDPSTDEARSLFRDAIPVKRNYYSFITRQ